MTALLKTEIFGRGGSSGFECFIIMLLDCFFGLFYDFLGNAGYALKIR